MYANTYCVHNVHNSTVVGRGEGGGCLRGLSYYFPRFQKGVIGLKLKIRIMSSVTMLKHNILTKVVK